MTVTLENGFLKQQLAAQSSTTASAVKLVIVNLMPNKLETERQFVNLLAALSKMLGLRLLEWPPIKVDIRMKLRCKPIT